MPGTAARGKPCGEVARSLHASAAPAVGALPPLARSRTVFWKVAALLVGAQVATALVAVALSAALVRARSDELVRGTIALQLDAVAEEVEARAAFDAFGGVALDGPLARDLATRFDDPLAVLDADGAVLDTFGTWHTPPALPPGARAALDSGAVAVAFDGEGWAAAPLLAPDGLPAGAVLVQPLTASVAEAIRPTREAVRLASWAAAVLAALVALALGGVVTAQLVGTLRRVTRRIARLGEGDYADRLPEAARPDELGRLAGAVNEMAAAVEASMERLRATDRVRRELVANVGHDLRTPLAALALALDEAQRLGGEGRDAEAASALADARTEADHATSLVADLFELSRLEAPGGDALRREPVPVGEWLREASAPHARAFARDGVALTLDLPPGLPTLEADGARLVRLLSNLLDNARRHAGAGGAVRLSARADAGIVTVAVDDSGPGLPDGDAERVFERYYRGDSARTRGVEGSGLGLAIARAVAEAHGGTLTAGASDLGGARFTLTLPPAASREPDAAPGVGA